MEQEIKINHLIHGQRGGTKMERKEKIHQMKRGRENTLQNRRNRRPIRRHRGVARRARDRGRHVPHRERLCRRPKTRPGRVDHGSRGRPAP